MAMNLEKVRNQILEKFDVSKRGRVFLHRRAERVDIENINEIQISSYQEFLQEDVDPERRANVGLQFLFNSVFPFTSDDKKVRIEFKQYIIGEKKYTREEAIALDQSYVVPIRAVIELILEERGEIKEQEIYICDMPSMTETGTFIINGAERVVVSQIHRSPGVVFGYSNRANMFHSRLIPNRGPWLEFEIVKDVMYVRIDRKARLSIVYLLKVLGIIRTREDVIRTFFETESVTITDDKEAMIELLADRYFAIDLKEPSEDGTEEIVIFAAGTKIFANDIDKLMSMSLGSVELVTVDSADRKEVLLNTIEKDMSVGSDKDKDESNKNIFDLSIEAACFTVFHLIRGSELNASMDAQKEVENIFFDEAYYSLGSVGRYKINKKFAYEKEVDNKVLTRQDIVSTVKYLLDVRRGDIPVDDIDHLGNRRIRCMGEQLTNHLKVAFSRVERLAKEHITIQDHDVLTPQNLISIKPITAGIREFFGTAQLSQFMDQTNPLATITHKRRLNALGPGGLTRERAGFEVRDIHYTHYGRMCPIETPEGPNIGLIVSLASFSRINQYGFIETPYWKVKNGKVTDELIYLSAIEEDHYTLTPFNIHLDKNNVFIDEMISCRKRGNYPMVDSKVVEYMDVSPKQIISISSSLIPFLEHDDANRALMGSNMQRQAVPLYFQEAPIVGTGVEQKAAEYSGFCQVARRDGVVQSVDNSSIEIKTSNGEMDVYKLVKSKRTNQSTYFNQRPMVKLGDKVEKGELVSDGSAIADGELALGKNVLTAFMTWEGYNYEDAILMSERLLKEDTYTSIHIEEFEVEARETKLGKEQITRDAPSIPEEHLKDLDDDGLIRVGSYVKAGSVVVGKITPKGHTEITPEYKLLHSIFGEKAKDVKDTSLRVPHGAEGTVIDVKRYTRENRNDLKPGVIESIKVFIAKKRKLKEGDKFAGRHGNKGVVARVMPSEDMPFLPDGRSIDLVLNPLGVPSRMNIGQIFETILGWVGKEMNVKFATPVFNGIDYDGINQLLEKIGLPQDGKVTLMDGRTGEPFKNPCTVGYKYYLKLAHLADDKVHARSTGPYSLVTQQPLGGKAQFGGQRVGEMEVWAIEAYGAASILQEFLTVKADAMEGRTRIYESIVKGEYVSTPGIPESFNVLVQELRGLGLNIEIYGKNNEEINITPRRKRDKKRFI